MISSEFLTWFKAATETKWSRSSINPGIYGFQFLPGTRWNPGLSEAAVREYEEVLDARFPNDFRALLRFANGTDRETLNVYGSSGEPSSRWVGVYSYPRDIEIVREQIEYVSPHLDEICAHLAMQGCSILPGSRLVPIYAHRFVVCGSDPESSVVLSIVINGAPDSPIPDAIVYGRSLESYLRSEFLGSESEQSGAG
jgi:hypothetical protein